MSFCYSFKHILLIFLTSVSNALEYPNFKVSLLKYKTVGDHLTSKCVDNPAEYNRDICAEVLLQHWNAHLAQLRISENKSEILKWDSKYAESVLSVIPTEVARCFLNLKGGIVDYTKFNADIIECKGCDPENFTNSNWNYLFLVNFIYSVMTCKYGDIFFYDENKGRYTSSIYNALCEKYPQYKDRISKAKYDIETYIKELKLFDYFSKFTNTSMYGRNDEEIIKKLEHDNGREYLDEIGRVVGITRYDYKDICQEVNKKILCADNTNSLKYIKHELSHIALKYKFDLVTFDVDNPYREYIWSVTYMQSDGNLLINNTGLLVKNINKFKKLKNGNLLFFCDDYSASDNVNNEEYDNRMINRYNFPNVYGYQPTIIRHAFSQMDLIYINYREKTHLNYLIQDFNENTQIFKDILKKLNEHTNGNCKLSEDDEQKYVKTQCKISCYYCLMNQVLKFLRDYKKKPDFGISGISYLLNQPPTEETILQAVKILDELLNIQLEDDKSLYKILLRNIKNNTCDALLKEYADDIFSGRIIAEIRSEAILKNE